MKKILELIAKIKIKFKILKNINYVSYMICSKLKLNLHGNNKLHMYWTYSKKILIKYHYLICCKLKVNLHRNNKLCMYWTYTLLSWFIFQNFFKFYFQIQM